jgi:hemolysin activation/secretion protein
VRYGLPVGTDGGRLDFIGQSVWQRPPTTFNGQSVDLLGQSIFGRVQYSQPMLRGLKLSVIGIAAIDVIEVDYHLQGTNIPGDSLRVLRGGASATYADDFDGVWMGTVLGSVGLGVISATSPGRPSATPDFLKLNVTLQRSQAIIGTTLTAIARATAQVASATVPTSEVFGFGGREFGRAFDVAASVGDQGVAVSGELRYAPEWLAFAKPTVDPQLYVYADYGRLWADNPVNAPFFAEGASVGGGLRLRLFDRAAGVFELGKVVAGQVAFSSDPQPWRFSFRVGTTF